jgi:hypothetical protein
LYFNTGTNTMKVYDGSSWLAAYATLSGALIAANNLSDLTNTTTAITNLGLGTLATQSGTFSGTSSGTNTGDQTNITGNAATATNVAYSGLTGTVPTWNQNTTGTAAGLSSVLAVSSGGTGTATPSLVAGSNITISGTFPNQTITGSAAGVTSVSATSPIASTGGFTPTISIPQATTSVSGYLTATDWNTFNGKQAAGSYVTVGGALGTPSSGTLTNCTFPTLNQNTTGSSGSCTGNAATATNFNNGTAYSGSGAYAGRVYVDVLNSVVAGDYLEFCYDSGVGVRVGTGANGSLPLYAGSLYDAGNRVYSAGNPQTNISGNAATATYATTAGRAYPYRVGGVDLNFNWSGQSGQPPWLWGGSDGSNMYVYNPSNFSVNYANTAGSAPANGGTSAACSGNAATATALSTASGSAPSYSARAWVNFNGQGTIAIRASANISSITDNGVGKFRLNFTTAMPDANYTFFGGCVHVPGVSYGLVTALNGTLLTTSIELNTFAQTTGIYDPPTVTAGILR